MKHVTERASCRLCSNKSFNSILNLGYSALANDFICDKNTKQETYPLHLHQCQDCGLFQLLDIVNPELMFSEYIYKSGTSQVMRDHFNKYANDVVDFLNLQPDDLVVDLGSNDGTLLKAFKQRGMCVVGVEPASNLADAANGEEIETINSFFNIEVATNIVNEFGKAKLVTMNNCLAHLDNIDEIIAGVKELLDDDGVFIFENAYFMDSLKTNDFSQVYHEHLSYFTVKPLYEYFIKQGMTLYRVEKQNIHGGSIKCFVRQIGIEETSENVQKILNEEENIKTSFQENVKSLSTKLKLKLKVLKGKGKSIAGVCAAAKSTTLLHYCDIGTEILDCIFDDASDKQGKFSPGKNIPILPFSDLKEKNPDYLLILSYNFTELMINKYPEYKGKWITCFPEVKII